MEIENIFFGLKQKEEKVTQGYLIIMSNSMEKTKLMQVKQL